MREAAQHQSYIWHQTAGGFFMLHRGGAHPEFPTPCAPVMEWHILLCSLHLPCMQPCLSSPFPIPRYVFPWPGQGRMGWGTQDVPLLDAA